MHSKAINCSKLTSRAGQVAQRVKEQPACHVSDHSSNASAERLSSELHESHTGQVAESRRLAGILDHRQVSNLTGDDALAAEDLHGCVLSSQQAQAIVGPTRFTGCIPRHYSSGADELMQYACPDLNKVQPTERKSSCCIINGCINESVANPALPKSGNLDQDMKVN